MRVCSEIILCLVCVIQDPPCFFVKLGNRTNPIWKCVASMEGLTGVKFTVTNKTSEYCNDAAPHDTLLPSELSIVAPLALCLATVALTGLIVMICWIRKQKIRTSPQPDRRAIAALGSISDFARQAEMDRNASRSAFNQRNAEFERQLQTRLEAVRRQRQLIPPPNTPEPNHRPLSQSTRESTPCQQHSRSVTPFLNQPDHSSRCATPAPPALDLYGSCAPSPFLNRGGTPAPPVLSPEYAVVFDNDSSPSTIYESVGSSPHMPVSPPSSPQAGSRSRFGRLLKRTSFFKFNP